MLPKRAPAKTLDEIEELADGVPEEATCHVLACNAHEGLHRITRKAFREAFICREELICLVPNHRFALQCP